MDVLSERDLRLPITLWMGVAGTTWSGGAGLDLDQLGAFVAAMKEATQAEVMRKLEEER